MNRRSSAKPSLEETAGLRVIGGTYRGRVLKYSGDLRTRPMKDRVREAVFNLLADSVKGTFVLDLFAGTGALGLEALSRGAVRALFLERHLPTVEIIQSNIALLGAESRAEAKFGDTFLWARRPSGGLGPLPTDCPWLVFCSPPYDFYLDRKDEMITLLERLLALATPGSTFVVECDERFALTDLPESAAWESRAYPPAIIAWMTTQL
jgi:16S rRNA (guanine966-N2)-methyltransferase